MGFGARSARCASADDQLRPQLIGEAGDDLVLHFEEIGERLVEAVGPEMIAALRVDELDIDAHAVGVALDRPFEHIADPKLLADFPGVDILALEREGGVAGDHEGAAEARQVGGQVLGDSVGEIVLASGRLRDWRTAARRWRDAWPRPVPCEATGAGGPVATAAGRLAMNQYHPPAAITMSKAAIPNSAGA